MVSKIWFPDCCLYGLYLTILIKLKKKYMDRLLITRFIEWEGKVFYMVWSQTKVFVIFWTHRLKIKFEFEFVSCQAHPTLHQRKEISLCLKHIKDIPYHTILNYKYGVTWGILCSFVSLEIQILSMQFILLLFQNDTNEKNFL